MPKTTQDATERRSRDDADHAPVEHPERSSPETLHNILTRPHVNSSGYSEDRFKVVLNLVNASDSASQHASAFQPALVSTSACRGVGRAHSVGWKWLRIVCHEA